MQANLRPACPEDIRSLFTGFQLLFKNKIRSRSLAAFTHTLTRLQNKQKQTLVTERKKKTWHKRHISPHSSPLREVLEEERVRLSDRNSILMTKNLSEVRSEALIG